jgi:hypothetical protein
MRENKERINIPLDTLCRSAVGSAESRAAARAILELRDGRAPDLHLRIVSFAAVKSGHFDFRRAAWQDKQFVRETSESLEEFTSRVRDALPIGGEIPKLIQWFER